MKRYIFLLASFLFSVLVQAQNYEVTPMTLNFNAEPGESQTKFMIVKNHKSTTETFILSVSDYSINSRGKGEYVEAGSMKQSVANWVSIAPSFFELEPNEEKEIAVTFQMPADEYGSKWGMIFVSPAREQTAYSADKSLRTGVIVSPRVAVTVYQTPGSNKTYNATIGNLMEVKSINEDSVRTFSALVNNVGDIVADCKVYVIATNIETTEETNYPEQAFMMFPKSARKIDFNIPANLPKGTYSLAAILDYGSKENLEGAQMVIVVD